MGPRITLKIEKTIAATVKGVAEKYAEDLREFLWHNHRITGDLALSLEVTAAPNGQSADVSSDMPYAGLFERKTGAVLKFTTAWASRGGKAAKQVATKVAGRLS